MVKKLDTWGGVKFRSEANGMFVWIFWGGKMCVFSQHSKSQEEQKIVFVWMFEVYTFFFCFWRSCWVLYILTTFLDWRQGPVENCHVISIFLEGGIQQTLGRLVLTIEVIGGSCLGKLPQVGWLIFSTKVNGWRMADVLKNLVTSMVFQESFCVFFFKNEVFQTPDGLTRFLQAVQVIGCIAHCLLWI